MCVCVCVGVCECACVRVCACVSCNRHSWLYTAGYLQYIIVLHDSGLFQRCDFIQRRKVDHCDGPPYTRVAHHLCVCVVCVCGVCVWCVCVCGVCVVCVWCVWCVCVCVWCVCGVCVMCVCDVCVMCVWCACVCLRESILHATMVTMTHVQDLLCIPP